MEKSTKTILWVLAFITLPITIPLAIISLGMVLTAIALLLGLITMYPDGTIILVIILIVLGVLNKLYPVPNKTE